MYKRMDYYCYICDKMFGIQSKTRNPESLTHDVLDKCIHIKHTIQNFDFFDKDENFTPNKIRIII